MNQPQWNSLQALQVMKQGIRIQLHLQPVLLRYEKQRVLVSGNGYTCRLEESDFLELYANASFVSLKEQAGIDEKKDEEYYAWRARSQ